MNPAPELAPMLKKLHLNGLLETLEKRNREAIERKMAYKDFLATLISDEVARREQNLLTQLSDFTQADPPNFTKLTHPISSKLTHPISNH